MPPKPQCSTRQTRARTPVPFALVQFVLVQFAFGTALLAVVATLAGCPAPAPKPTPKPTPKPAPKPTAQTPVVRDVLYKAQWPGWDIRLLGIDPEKGRAFLWQSARQPNIALVLDTIDYRNGKRLERWSAAPKNADRIMRGYPVFRRWNDSLETDLVRFSTIIKATGPWSTRARALSPNMAVDPAGNILYGAPPTDGRDGDWLFVADAQGKNPRRLDTGAIRASYKPTISPDGRRVAWRACSTKHARAGNNCSYFLALTTLQPTAKPQILPAIPKPSWPVWSPDSNTVYTVSTTRNKACLFAVNLAPKNGKTSKTTPQKLHCKSNLRDARFLQDNQGKRGVFLGFEGPPGQQNGVYHILDLTQPDAPITSTHLIPRATAVGTLSNLGTLVVPTQDGLAVLDTTRARSGTLPSQQGRYVGVRTSQWLEDRDLILVQILDDGFELVRINTEQILLQP